MIAKAETKPRTALSEAIDLFGGMSQFGQAYGSLFASDGNLWNSVAGPAASGGAFFSAFYWASTLWFNRMQRYAARYCFLSNGYGSTAVRDLTILAMGEGFTLSSQNEEKDAMLKRWMKATKYHQRSIRGFKRFLVDGEVFYRVKGQGEDSRYRFIDPDLVYSDPIDDKKDYFAGLLFDDDDDENPRAYKLWSAIYGESAAKSSEVPASQMQHRANREWGQKRGFSWMLPVLPDLFGADALTGNLSGAAEVLSKFALIRQHQAPESAAALMRAQIQANSRAFGPGIGVNGGPVTAPTEPAERYPVGAIVDSSESTEYRVLEGVNYAQFGELLDMLLRKISSQFYLPMGIFAQDKSERGSYASELAAGSWNVRNIKSLQDEWKRQDLELIEMCGIETDDIDITAPEISVVDKKAAVEEEKMLMENMALSPQTLAKNHDLDFDQEARNWATAKKKYPELYDQPEDEEQGDREEEDSIEFSEAEYDESKHPRGQPDNAGKFGPGGGAKKEKPQAGKKQSGGKGKSGKLDASKEKQPAAKSGVEVRIAPTKTRAFNGQPVEIKTKLSKQDAGKIGEGIIIAWLKYKGMADARQMNLDRNNFPIDLIQDHETIEAKTGNAGNGASAQQWRLTIGQPGKAETEWLKTASAEDKAAWNKKKQSAIHERKQAVLDKLGKEMGHKIKSATMTVILNPDTKTADVYKFEGWHDRIAWNSDQAKKAYVGSVRYSHD